jgi:hypothetical protein
MTAVSNRLTVWLVGDDIDDSALIRRAFRRISHFARLVHELAADELHSLLNVDAALSPVPDILILAGALRVRMLCRLRQQPVLNRLPVVVLSAGLSAAEAETVRQLNAACCTPVLDSEQMAAAIEDAVCKALHLAWEAPGHDRSAPREPCLIGLPAFEPIRVWT